MSPTDKFNQANHNFKSIYYAGKQRERKNKPNKYKWLPDWTLNKSNYLLHEHDPQNRNKKVYKRGSIVNVDFGVNVGQELTGNHFAIILNKHDNSRNDKLTVIPLTSHEHPNTVKLDKTILNLSLEEFIQAAVRLSTINYALIYVLYTAAKKINPDTKTPYEQFLLNANKQETDEEKMVIQGLADSLNKDIPDNDSAIATLKNYPPLTEHSDNILDYIINNNISNKIIHDVNLVSEAMNKYKSYNKETWAKISDIQTVSKTRLIRINSADPIGKIKVSPSVLNTIDKEIRKQFTK
ncbi:hypothetical protein LOSG293_110780 [Secundilactobacillus oryzae JCM 18671]|uniref:Uncharacterized protein n=1 Tax=Secundilactobacillus oryzae JCM 18671 TaxID=1291743 RepID=A0A081BI94_9LACO|nr:type II toxin-antitoxin system PemK/MazF family toxin [Secundilactobacillus oryzae]GAK47762.1 hypothetical protein LOSG293_110780 [Secundilactobacillus oryzae JCM 18671]